MSVAQSLSELDANLRRADAVAAGLSRAEFNWRPAPGSWSVAQCVSHLNVVNGQDLAGIQRAVSSARERGITGGPPFRYGWASRKFVAVMEPPVRNRVRAPKRYVPPPEADPEATLAEYRRIGGELRRLIASADGLDWRRVKTSLPPYRPCSGQSCECPLGRGSP